MYIKKYIKFLQLDLIFKISSLGRLHEVDCLSFALLWKSPFVLTSIVMHETKQNLIELLLIYGWKIKFIEVNKTRRLTLNNDRINMNCVTAIIDFRLCYMLFSNICFFVCLLQIKNYANHLRRVCLQRHPIPVDAAVSVAPGNSAKATKAVRFQILCNP